MRWPRGGVTPLAGGRDLRPCRAAVILTHASRDKPCLLQAGDEARECTLRQVDLLRELVHTHRPVHAIELLKHLKVTDRDAVVGGECAVESARSAVVAIKGVVPRGCERILLARPDPLRPSCRCRLHPGDSSAQQPLVCLSIR